MILLQLKPNVKTYDVRSIRKGTVKIMVFRKLSFI
jgi:hypothetical protein